jgi:hypothetical protein
LRRPLLDPRSAEEDFELPADTAALPESAAVAH